MAFILKTSDSYSWPVAIDIPVDHGKHERRTFDAQFKRVNQSRIREMGELIESGDLTDIALVQEVLVGWDGINDEDGNPVKFSNNALMQICEIPMAATGIAQVFFQSIAGSKRKN